MKHLLRSAVIFVSLFSLTAAAGDTFKIHINQIGFVTESQKQAVYNGTPSGEITLKSVDGGTINHPVSIGAPKTWGHSGEASNSVLDFSAVTETGRYALFEGDNRISPEFEIGVHYDALLKDALRFFYLHRASTTIDEPYADGWARAAGHNMDVQIYDDNASPTGVYIKSHRGWYDAGDYGRYVVNSGISTYTLLALYEKYSDKIPNLNIPTDDSIPALPQLLSEIKWNLDWMLTMQASDGGVYHKMTENNFGAADHSPAQSSAPTRPHSVMGKTTTATLDFAAVMAVASRIYSPFNEAYADKMLSAAKSAWNWAVTNPAKIYGTAVKDPTGTGSYSDNKVTDELHFAAAALAVVTSGDEQTPYIDRIKTGSYSSWAAGWQDVGSLGTLEIVRNRNKFPTQIYDAAVGALTEGADNMLGDMNSYGLPFNSVFWWGSNSVAANLGIQLLQAYDLTEDVKYKNVAQTILDYLLGRNPLDQCYVTGYGHNPVKNTHDRLSASFGMNESLTGPEKAIPGQLAGGASGGGCKGADNFTTVLATKYEDTYDCYGYNEVAINWNAPLAFLLAALNDQNGLSVRDRDRPRNPNTELSGFPVAVVTAGEFTAGPNPAAKLGGEGMKFFWLGKNIKNSTLLIYNSSGKLVKKITIKDNAKNVSSKRMVGSWDLTESKGRHVPEGTYVVKGTINGKDGKKEKISLVIGVN